MAETATPAPATDRTGGRRGLLLPIAGGLAVAVAGFLDGRYVAYLSSRPAFFARIDVLLVLAATIVAATVLALAVRRLMRGQTREPQDVRGVVWGGLALLSVGFAAGWLTAGSTGALYREAVVLEAVGKAAGEVTNVDGFIGVGDRVASCSSVSDGMAVGWVEGEDLGSIHGLTLRASFALPEAGIPTFRGEVFVDGGDLPEGAGAPVWTGMMMIADLGPDGRHGLVDFAALELVTDPPARVQPNGDPWPSTLAGSIRWSCGDWFESQDD